MFHFLKLNHPVILGETTLLSLIILLIHHCIKLLVFSTVFLNPYLQSAFEPIKAEVVGLLPILASALRLFYKMSWASARIFMN